VKQNCNFHEIQKVGFAITLREIFFFIFPSAQLFPILDQDRKQKERVRGDSDSDSGSESRNKKKTFKQSRRKQKKNMEAKK